MDDNQFHNAKQVIIKRLQKDKEKELHCHIQFVVKVGLELAKRYNADRKIIELSCLLHDIGRDHEIGDENHGDAGVRIAAKLLQNTGIPQNEIDIILGCIKHHNKIFSTSTLEEKIVMTADSASKVLYHEAFMLLCKKRTYEEKLVWAKKYLEKGYSKTLFPDYKQYITEHYNMLKQIYESIPASFTV